MKVISASRRTDIPAFYTPWLMNRIRAGLCEWVNPFGGQRYTVSLRPEDVLAIVFWTRNPAPLLPHIAELHGRGYRFYAHMTITGYPRVLESHTPPLEAAIEALQRLADAIGPPLVHWRYDPLVLSSATPAEWHLRQFDLLSSRLAGGTHRCYLSFVDLYGKTRRNLGRLAQEQGIAFHEPELNERRALAGAMQQIAAARGITLYSCCEDDLVVGGVQKAHCIHLEMVRVLRGDAALDLKAAPSRQECGCVQSVDIGAYDTCLYGCAYCYATNSRQAALARYQRHDVEDAALLRPRSTKISANQSNGRESLLPHS